MKKSICTHCYHQNNCPVDPNYKAECAPAIITTCTDYDPEYEPPYREPFGNDDCDVPYVNYEQEPEPDDYELDYYEQGTQSTPIDAFTEALLDWLDDSKSK